VSTAATTTLTRADHFQDVLYRIQYKGWEFRVGGEPGRLWMMVVFDAPDTDGRSSVTQMQHGRKWLLSEHMTDSEVVQTAFKAVMAAEEHEARETFLVDGVAVLGPHFDLFKLAALHRRGALPVVQRAAIGGAE
jgi:hypothetical protein